MAKKKHTVLIEHDVKGGAKLKKATEETKKHKKAIDEKTKAQKRSTKADTAAYNATKQGVIQTAPAAKNFSKMSRAMDGGTGDGGLVRAYALLAANVFALTAAFGVLSRAAQTDTLMEAMVVLEKTTGNSVNAIGRELQRVTGYGMDLAESMRATSLALSAGFDTTAITELGEVARNAAVSLGRPMGDALDRIFRGVIKVEPELLDEIGLFVRVKDASAKYASELGVAASSLTEFEKRQAFAAEAIRQGQEKFEDFADVDTDQFSRLAAVFADIAQQALSFLNTVAKPLIDFFAGSTVAISLLFTTIVGLLLKKAVPAMGYWSLGAKEAAADAIEANKKYQDDLNRGANNQRTKAYEIIDVERNKTKELLAESRKQRAGSLDYEGQKGSPKKGSALAQANAKLAQKGLKREEKINALVKKQNALRKSSRKQTEKAVDAAIKKLQKEIDLERKILEINKKRAKIKGDFPDVIPGKGSIAMKRGQDLKRNEIFATGLQNIAGSGEFQGVKAAWGTFRKEMKALPEIAKKNKVPLSTFQKGLFALKGAGAVGAIGIQQVGMAINAAMGWIALIIPLLMGLMKWLGHGNKAHKAYQEAASKTAETLEHMSDKIDHQTQVLRDSTTTSQKWVEANFAMTKTLAQAGQAVIDQMKAWDEFKRKGTEFAIFWEEMKQAIWGGGAEENQEDFLRQTLRTVDLMEESTKNILKDYGDLNALQKELTKNNKVDRKAEQEKIERLKLMKDTLKNFGDRTTIADKLPKGDRDSDKRRRERLQEVLDFTGLEKAGPMRDFINDSIAEATRRLDGNLGADMIDAIIKNIPEEERGKLVELLAGDQKYWDEAGERMKSITQSAIDVARNYADTFITKTDLDQPLELIKQITAEREKQASLDPDALVKRGEWLKLISQEDSAIRSLMTVKEKEKFDAAAKKDSQEEMLDILDDVEARYQKQQRLLITNKNLTKAITEDIKILSKIQAKAGEVAAFVLNREQEKLDIVIKTKEAETERYLQQLDLDKETVEEKKKIRATAMQILATETEWAAVAKELGISTAELANLRSHFLQEGINDTKKQLSIDTEHHHLNLAIEKTLLDRIKTYEKLNAEKKKGFELDAKISAFENRGTTKLNLMEEAKILLDTERRRLEIAEEKARIEKAIITAQYGIIKVTMESMKAQIDEYNKNLTTEERIAGGEIDIVEITKQITAAENALKDAIDESSKNAGKQFAISWVNQAVKGLKKDFSTEIKSITDDNSAFSAGQARGLGIGTLGLIGPDGELNENAQMFKDAMEAVKDESQEVQDAVRKMFEEMAKAANKNKTAIAIGLARDELHRFADAVRELGAEGELAATMAEFTSGMLETAMVIGDAWENGGNKVQLALQGMSYALQGIAQIAAASGRAKIEAIDREIDAEKRRDGQSKASLDKLKALEQKKEMVARKSFETNKKLQMANAVVTIASAMAQTAPLLSNPVTFGIGVALMGMIAALGAAQLAIISGTQYGGFQANQDKGTTQGISVGKRDSKIDVSRRAGSGELAYLRGDKGIGSSGNFIPMGGAAGLRKGYAEGGVLVGERGPEMIQPTTGFNVVPNDELGGKPVNAHFTIHAIDAAGVEEVLLGQQGNIISMIRSAANDNGEEFLESVNTDHIAAPKSAGGVDY